jgi:GST-like protein
MLLPKETAARFDAIQWMMVQMTGLGPMFGQYVHFMRFAREGNDYAFSRYRTQVRRVLDVMEERLAAVPHLGGADYSIADVATFPWARGIETMLGVGPAEYPNLTRWVKAIAARPAVARALAAADAVRGKTTPFDKAAPDVLDKVFGRGEFAAA